MSKFDDFFKEVLSTVKDVGGTTAEDFLKDTSAEGLAFKRGMEENLQRWTKQLADGEIDEDMFKDLLRGQMDTAILAALAKAGKGAAEAKALGKKIVDTAITAAFKILI